MRRVSVLPLDKLRDSGPHADFTESASTYVKWGDTPHNYEARMQKETPCPQPQPGIQASSARVHTLLCRSSMTCRSGAR